MARSVAEIVDAYNAGREPERLALKRVAMREDAFAFFRGTAHLFWQRARERGVNAAAPTAWCSGDLHLENFGAYLGDNGLAYFDINDFDEAAKAPCDWEVLRLLTSIAVAAPELGLGKQDTTAAMVEAAEAYRTALADGKARWVERNTASGAIGDLIAGLKSRTRERLLDKRTTRTKQHRALDVPTAKQLPITDAVRTQLKQLAASLHDLLPGVSPDSYFTLIDGARRIAGNGSLGLARYVLLVEGEGSPNGNALLDVKAAVASSLAAQSPCVQPLWRSEADRVVVTQNRCQAIAPNLLHAVSMGGQAFVLKELQPSEDRLDLAKVAKRAGSLPEVVRTMSRIAAWAQIRSAARDGAATPDELSGFARGAGTAFSTSLTETAHALAETTKSDYAAYCAAGDASGRAKT